MDTGLIKLQRKKIKDCRSIIIRKLPEKPFSTHLEPDYFITKIRVHKITHSTELNDDADDSDDWDYRIIGNDGDRNFNIFQSAADFRLSEQNLLDKNPATLWITGNFHKSNYHREEFTRGYNETISLILDNKPVCPKEKRHNE